MNKYELSREATKLLRKAAQQQKERSLKKKPRKDLRKVGKKLKTEIDSEKIQKAFSDVQFFTKIHLRIRGIVDVWPSTGRFYNRVTRAKGIYSGIADLIEEVERAERYRDSRSHAVNKKEIEARESFFRNL